MRKMGLNHRIRRRLTKILQLSTKPIKSYSKGKTRTLQEGLLMPPNPLALTWFQELKTLSQDSSRLLQVTEMQTQEALSSKRPLSKCSNEEPRKFWEKFEIDS